MAPDLSDDLVAALRQQISALNEAVAALTGCAPALTATVQVLAGRGDAGGDGGASEALMMPLDAYRRTTFLNRPPMPYLGVEVRGHGHLPVWQAGLEFDLGEVAPAVYLLPSEIQHRDEQHEVRLIDHDRLRASILELGKITGRLPQQFRGFVQLGDGRQVSGVWTPMLELPIWRDKITEEDLQRLQRRPSAS